VCIEQKERLCVRRVDEPSARREPMESASVVVRHAEVAHEATESSHYGESGFLLLRLFHFDVRGLVSGGVAVEHVAQSADAAGHIGGALSRCSA
jgi:hypothetical protein